VHTTEIINDYVKQSVRWRKSGHGWCSFMFLSF